MTHLSHLPRRALATLTAAAACAALAVAAPTGADAATLASASSCTKVAQIGTTKVVSDKGMQAFTVRQFRGWCADSRGSAWMNYSSTYVWSQYHVRGFSYRAYAGVAVTGQDETEGFVAGANRQQLVTSRPVRTVTSCTQGWGKLYRGGAESAQGLTSLIC
ncbi:MAG: hypothetical protein ABI336_03985 [Humibacillus sp.]